MSDIGCNGGSAILGDINNTIQAEDYKRKRGDLSANSSGESSVLSLKRIKEALSFGSSSPGDCESGDSLCMDSVNGNSFATSPMPAVLKDGKGEQVTSTTQMTTPLPAPNCSSTPKTIMPSVDLSSQPSDAVTLNAIEAMMERVLDRKLMQVKEDIKSDILSDISPKIDEVNGKIFDLEQENSDLKKRVQALEKARQVEHDNIESAKARAIENDQYARRSNILIFGLEEKTDDDLIPQIKKTVEDKLKIKLKKDDIEICHRMGQKALNKIRPIVTKFRYRDTKWDVMKARRSLKGTGITFSEDMVSELQNLQKALEKHPGVEASWAWNGKIMAKDLSGKVKIVRYGSDIDKMFPGSNQKQSEQPMQGEDEPPPQSNTYL